MNARVPTNRRGISGSTVALYVLVLALMAATTLGLFASAESVSTRLFVLRDSPAPTAIVDGTDVVRMPGRPY